MKYTCFSLTRKEETEPTSLFLLDQDIRTFLKEQDQWKPEGHGQWAYNWTTEIGWRLSTGDTLEGLRKDYEKIIGEDVSSSQYKTKHYFPLLLVVHFLEAHFHCKSWVLIEPKE